MKWMLERVKVVKEEFSSAAACDIVITDRPWCMLLKALSQLTVTNDTVITSASSKEKLSDCYQHEPHGKPVVSDYHHRRGHRANKFCAIIIYLLPTMCTSSSIALSSCPSCNSQDRLFINCGWTIRCRLLLISELLFSMSSSLEKQPPIKLTAKKWMKNIFSQTARHIQLNFKYTMIKERKRIFSKPLTDSSLPLCSGVISPRVIMTLEYIRSCYRYVSCDLWLLS